MRSEKILLYDTAAEIWEAAKEAYSHVENTPELFNIESLLHDQRQEELSVTQYFNILNQNWQQLDMFENHKWSCSNDALYYKKIVEQKRLYKFLIGLNKSLDDEQGRILSRSPLPSLLEAFAEVRREESRKKLMMGKPNPPNEASAMATRGGQYSFNNRKQRKDRPRCDHCHKIGHTKERCWDLHEEPEDNQFPSGGDGRSDEVKFVNRKDGRDNSAISEGNSDTSGASPFSKE